VSYSLDTHSSSRMKVVRAFQGVLLLVLVVLVVLLPQAPAIQAFAPSSGGLLQQRRAAASTTTTATTSRTALVRASANSPDDGGGAGKGKPWDSPEWLMKARNMREKFEKELLKANTLFYDSLSGQDADYLEEAWMNDPVVHLVRPAFQERGHEPIVRACQAIGREAKNKKCRFVPTAAKVNVVGATAWVVFKEHLRTSTGAAGRHPYYVTNVFRRVCTAYKYLLTPSIASLF
jgi:ketosteroid isomerase-like protein